ncbi:hypothetical protein [Piscinibacter sakaiensis]
MILDDAADPDAGPDDDDDAGDGNLDAATRPPGSTPAGRGRSFIHRC